MAVCVQIFTFRKKEDPLLGVFFVNFLCVLLLGADNEQDRKHQNEANRQDDQRILDETGQHKSHKGDTCSQKCIGQLGVHVIDMLTLSTG